MIVRLMELCALGILYLWKIYIFLSCSSTESMLTHGSLHCPIVVLILISGLSPTMYVQPKVCEFQDPKIQIYDV
jgi:hypothetical protein